MTRLATASVRATQRLSSVWRGNPALGQRQQDHADHHHQQERPALQKRVGAVGKVDLDVIGRERADGERRQERADADCRGDADPLEDVEGEVHRAVP